MKKLLALILLVGCSSQEEILIPDVTVTATIESIQYDNGDCHTYPRRLLIFNLEGGGKQNGRFPVECNSVEAQNIWKHANVGDHGELSYQNGPKSYYPGKLVYWYSKHKAEKQ